jgi:hypothetical protein
MFEAGSVTSGSNATLLSDEAYDCFNGTAF